MIIDDSAYMRNMLRSILEMGGCEVVVEVGDSMECVAYYKLHRPDVVLVDRLMGGRTGIRTAGEILAFDPDAKVVLCQFVDEAKKDESSVRGITDVITKPYVPEQVLEKVFNCWSKR